ncbi:Peptidase C39 family protein OS=Streptomyces tendae OX=1932 GN=F3L20_10680 PE=4 SV=1 [Streptomyces tendae]
MSRAEQPSRRTLLAAAVVATAAGARRRRPRPSRPSPRHRGTATHRGAPPPVPSTTVPGPRTPTGAPAPPPATRAVAGVRPGLVLARTGRHHGLHRPAHRHARPPGSTRPGPRPSTGFAVPATEAIASWNAHTPEGTWIEVELKGTYSDGTDTPWYVMGRWAAGDATDIRRTSVDDQSDGQSSIWTDTFVDRRRGHRPAPGLLPAAAHPAPPPRHTQHARPSGGSARWAPTSPTASPCRPRRPRHAGELRVPRYSQEIHKGQYPEYDNGGEAWCSPTSSQMIVEYWGGRLTAEQLAWVDPVLRRPAGLPRRPVHVRQPVRGLRQLALQRRLRRHLRRHPGGGHPPRLAHRPGDADRGRYPRHNVPVVPGGGADRGGLRHLRAT